MTGDAAVTGDLTVTGNDITFGNSETISNSTDGDFLFTTGTTTGALTLKNSNTSNGVASIELVSDNGADVGDGYEVKSLNGAFTITSDHSSSGTYNDTYLTIDGNSNPASSVMTVAGELSATTLDIGGTNISASAAEINYNDITTLGTSEASKTVTVNASGDLIIPDGDKFQFGAGTDMTLYHDGSNSYITNATGDLKVATQASGIAVTIGHSTSETTVGDNLTVTGDATVTGDLTVTGNDITFGNSETISNGTDGDFLFTTATQTGALTLKNSNTSDGIASIELVSDNGADVGDGYELKSVNGTFTVTSDHSSSGTYNDTYLTIDGNSNPASSVMTVAGELSATTLDIGGTNISASATELNYTDVTTLGTSQASKAVTVDSNGDLLVPDSDKYKFGAGSDMQLYHDGTNSYITNATGAMKVATESSGIAVTIGHTTSETTIGDNLTVTGDAAVTGALTLGTALAVAEGGTGTTSLTDKAVLISQDTGTDAIGSVAMTGNGEILVGGTSGPAVEAAADVAGTGLDASTGDGTLAINVAAAQTSITSIINSGITKIGTAAAQEYITFGSANEVNTHINNTETLSVTASGVDVTGNATISGDLTISSALKGINTTSGSNVAHDENTSATLSANNNRRGKYTLTTDPVINNNNVSAKFTVVNSTTTADDIVIMNCTSNHQIEVHTFNVTSSGWDFFFVNRSGSDITTDQPLEFNFIVMQ